MLVLSRKKGQTLVIGDNIEITILEVQGDNVRIGIAAPRDVTVFRKEVYEEIQKENRQAAAAARRMKDQLQQLKGFPLTGDKGDGRGR